MTPSAPEAVRPASSFSRSSGVYPLGRPIPLCEGVTSDILAGAIDFRDPGLAVREYPPHQRDRGPFYLERY